MPLGPSPLNPAFTTLQRRVREKRVKLNFLKCQDCRRDKQKCHPAQGQWPEKCQRCQEKNLPCSEPKRARNASLSLSSCRASSSNIAETTSGAPNDSIVVPSTNTQHEIATIDFTMSVMPELSKVWIHDDVPFLIALLKFIRIEMEELERIARSMASPFWNAPNWTSHAKCLDDTFTKYHHFLQALKKDISARSWDDTSIRTAMIGTDFSHSISRDVGFQDNVQFEWELGELRNSGHHPLAFMTKLHRLLYYPGRITGADWQKFDFDQSQFALRLSHLQTSGDLPACDMDTIITTKLLLPSRFFKNNYTLINHMPRGVHDCLGRSIAHIAADAGLTASWVNGNVNQSDVLGRTALYFACREGNEALLDELLKLGADTDQCTVTGLTPLHVAASMGHKTLCEKIWLHQYGEVDWILITELPRDCTGRTAFLSACLCGHREVVDFFCAKIFRVERDVDASGNSAIGLTAMRGHTNIVKTLLKHDFPVNGRDNMGRTPFWHAVQGGHLGVMDLLKDKVHLDAKDNEGRTPLAEAAKRGLHKCVSYLLDLNKPLRNLNLVDWASLQDSSNIKLNYFVHPNSKDNRGKSPLILAAEARKPECVKLLLRDQPTCYSHMDIEETVKIMRLRAGDAVLKTITDGFQ